MVYGDYGLYNCIVVFEGYVVAVVDWEISMLGDLLVDLVYVLNAWVEFDDVDLFWLEVFVLVFGFLKRVELLVCYVERIGCDVFDIDFYAAFNYYKMVCILEGVYARYLKG